MRVLVNFALLVGAAVTLAVAEPSSAQAWPAHPIKFVVAAPAGSSIRVNSTGTSDSGETWWRT